MKINIIDFKGNLGGGINYNINLINNLRKKNFLIRVVSQGRTLQLYKKKLRTKNIEYINHKLANENKVNTKFFFSLKRTATLLKILGFGSSEEYILSKEIEKLDGTKLFLWPYGLNLKNIRISNSFFFLIHDVILFDFYKYKKKDFDNFKSIVYSKANLIFTSQVTLKKVKKIFNINKINSNIIRIPNKLIKNKKSNKRYKEIKKPYFIYPSNSNLHKNHEDLLYAFNKFKKTHALILTGDGTDFHKYFYGRQKKLMNIVKKLDFKINEDIFLLGSISSEKLIYYMSNSKAIVVTSKLEGGGSFPVIEGINLDKPVICNTVEAVKEYHKIYGGKIIYYKNNIKDLQNKIKLIINKKKFETEGFIKDRNWEMVANDYIKIINKTK